jgi:hypothetical protein
MPNGDAEEWEEVASRDESLEGTSKPIMNTLPMYNTKTWK